jgi:hypothetical protein
MSICKSKTMDLINLILRNWILINKLMKAIAPTIALYNKSSVLSAEEKRICEKLKELIDTELKNSESKIWHGAPVWFLDGNPTVGYNKQKAGIRLMFWSGADFEEQELIPGTGKFKDASIFYNALEEINETDLKRWIKKAQKIQWDYKNIIKNKGKLLKIT